MAWYIRRLPSMVSELAPAPASLATPDTKHDLHLLALRSPGVVAGPQLAFSAEKGPDASMLSVQPHPPPSAPAELSLKVRLLLLLMLRLVRMRWDVVCLPTSRV